MAVVLLKLSLLTLLAIFITQARSEPLPNSGGFDEELKRKGMTIPYLVCIKTCHNCACTYMYPPEANFCACMDTKPKPKPKPKPTDDDELVHKSAAGEFDQELKKKGFTIPYLTCIRTCHSCACTRMLPVEANFCACMDTKFKTNPTNDDELVHKSAAGEFDEKLLRKGKIPYLECIRTCHRCACTKMLPVESNFCTCMDTVVEDTQTNTKPTDNELLHKSAVGKGSWPELVGVKGETAAAKIERENPQVDAIVVKEGTPTTDARRHNRVWVWIDEHGVVTTVPRRG